MMAEKYLLLSDPVLKGGGGGEAMRKEGRMEGTRERKDLQQNKDVRMNREKKGGLKKGEIVISCELFSC